MKPLMAAWGAAFLVTAAMDAVALGLLIGPFFEARIGDIMRASPNLYAAAPFYLLYPLAIVHFAVRGRPAGKAGLQGALFGAVCYGVYETTNMTVMQGWTWSMVLLDVSWGAIVSAAGATAGAWAMGRSAAAPTAS